MALEGQATMAGKGAFTARKANDAIPASVIKAI
jgi:hypothetical protein